MRMRIRGGGGAAGWFGLRLNFFFMFFSNKKLSKTQKIVCHAALVFTQGNNVQS